MSKKNIMSRDVQLLISELATEARNNGLPRNLAAKLALAKCKLTPTSDAYLNPNRGNRLANVLSKFEELFGFEPFDFPAEAQGQELLSRLNARIQQLQNAEENELKSLQWWEFSKKKTAGTAQAFIRWYADTILPNLVKELAD